MATETSHAAPTAADREKVRAIREELPAVHARAPT